MAVRFGEFVLLEDERQVLRGDRSVHLEPKAFALLSMLVAHRPKAVSKEAIRERVWPDTHVSESSIAGLVLDLRTVLEDDPARPRFIRTVRGFGYAFSGDLLPGEAPLGAEPHRWAVVCAGREVPLPDGTHLVGRGEGCRVRLDSIRVSRCHARLVVGAEGVTIEDLGSRNGTWHAGRRLDAPAPLTAGATVRIGSETMTLVAAGPDAVTASDDVVPPGA